MSYAAIMMHRL